MQHQRLILVLCFLPADPELRQRYLLVQERVGAVDQLLPLQKEMTMLVSGVLQRVEQRPLDTHGVVQFASRLLNDGVHAAKAKAGDLAQAKRTLFENFHTARAKLLINLLRGLRRHLERR